jgi:stearoyl-CoA desaturase (delta-9 desaturase)
MQFGLAVLAMTSSQKGVIWWASHHRTHHKYSDLPGDVHSVKRDGLYWGHLGWILSRQYQGTDIARVRDLTSFPEIVWLDRLWWLPPTALGVGSFLVGGWFGLVWAFFVSTVLLWHGTFTINSLAHMIGRRRYATDDNSRNSALLALITLGEGWHNNHHHYQRSVRQGFFWWEFDPTYYVLRALALVGAVWDLHGAPAHVVVPRAGRARLGLSPDESAPLAPSASGRVGSAGSPIDAPT